MLTPEIKERLIKVYELVNRGDTEGERAAAKAALDKILNKYNLAGIDLESLNFDAYMFKYSSAIERMLLIQIVRVMMPDPDTTLKTTVRITGAVRALEFTLTYIDYITLSCAYEYFRPHMMKQWRAICAADIKRCRKAKTKNKRREELQDHFFGAYVIASKLYKPEDVEDIDYSKLSQKEIENRQKMGKVQGGKYNKQMNTGQLLN